MKVDHIETRAKQKFILPWNRNPSV
jgi:hypothetical protein